MTFHSFIKTFKIFPLPKDAEQAVKFGAEGIGLCRTEHMFFEADRIPVVREKVNPISLASSFISSSLCGKNSCKGGSKNLIVTG